MAETWKVIFRTLCGCEKIVEDDPQLFFAEATRLNGVRWFDPTEMKRIATGHHENVRIFTERPLTVKRGK